MTSGTKDRMRELFNPLLETLYDSDTPNEVQENAACPFMPYVGPDYAKSPIRLMVIGKATYGWGNDEDLISLRDAFKHRPDYDQLASISCGFVNSSIIPHFAGVPGTYSSAFWRVLYRALGAVLDGTEDYQRDPEASERRFRSLAWTNVFKVGGPHGNPNRKVRAMNWQYFDTLRREIELLDPHIILFPTNRSYDTYVDKALSAALGGHTDIREFEVGTARCLRTRHYMGMTSPAVDDVLAWVASEAQRYEQGRSSLFSPK